MEPAQTSRSSGPHDGPHDPSTGALPPMPPSNPGPQTQEASTHPGTTSSAGAPTAELNRHEALSQSAESITPMGQPPTSITANRPSSVPLNPLRMNTPRRASHRPSRVSRPSPLCQSESLDESEPRPPKGKKACRLSGWLSLLESSKNSPSTEIISDDGLHFDMRNNGTYE